MNSKIIFTAGVVLAAAALLAVPPAAQASHRHHSRKMVAYDAKDKRFYSVAYARAHGMHDRGGDLLTIVPMSSLPKAAKESRAMHGAKM